MPSCAFAVVAIAVHALAHLKAFLAAALLSRDLAIQLPNVALGKGADLAIGIVQQLAISAFFAW